MANPTTSEEWQTVADNLNAQMRDLENQQESLNDQFLELSRQRTSLRQQRSALGAKLSAEGKNPADDPTWRSLVGPIDDLSNQIAQIENQKRQLSDQIIDLDRDSQNALRQSIRASLGVPNASTNTPPASSGAGNPTDPPTPAAIIAPNIAPVTPREPVQNPEAAGQPPNIPAESQKTISNSNPTGPAYDDNGNLMPGWSLNENNNPVWIGNNPDGTIFVEPATQASAQESSNSAKGTSAVSTNAKAQGTKNDEVNLKQYKDWRVKLSLAPGNSVNYLYKAPEPGILAPLATTEGILFPYTPTISVQYAALYDNAEITHTNYKLYQYKSSNVDNITINCEFTAQDTFEANYLLAVIHFLRSVTKMFYGQDQNPNKGTPPPLCYLTGLGAFQFDAHPLAITNFTYTLPNDVDYIRAGTTTTNAGVNKSPEASPNNTNNPSTNRNTTLSPGGGPPPPKFSNVPGGTVEPTYVPTKINIQISCIPIITRNDISNNFSLKDYATGALLRGMSGNTRISKGFW